MIPWRLIDTGPLDGPANMAVDEALLLSFVPGNSSPTLRLYGWQPPALSLGRFQKAAEILDLEACATAGVPVVRRITGGGIIYHTEELTYSLVCAPGHLPPGLSIKDSFRALTAFLLTFYRNLGLAASYAVDHLPSGSRFGERTDFCFAGRESYDILLAGRKIGGNAQRRLKNAIFQHGSIPLRESSVKGVRFLREAPADLSEGTTCLAEHVSDRHEQSLTLLLADSFQEALGVILEPSALTAQEKEMTQQLLPKYRDGRWNLAGICADHVCWPAGYQ